MIEITKFALAGDATFTVVSKKTGTRFTFKVSMSEDGQRHYVSVLNGPDNYTNYRFFGTVFNGDTFRHGKVPEKTTITPEAPSAKAFTWIWNHRADPTLTEKVDIHHEGKCCRCGRKLTVPRSVELGCGPECAELMGVSF